MLSVTCLDANSAAALESASSRELSRFDGLLAEAERLHRQGRQRFALLAIDQMAELIRRGASPSLDALLEVIWLRKRVVLAMHDG